MIFFSFFKTLIGKEVAIELKNDVVMTGVLLSVDQYLNVKLKNVAVVNASAHPQLAAMKNCFIRGSAVRYTLILLKPLYSEIPSLISVFITTCADTFKFPQVKLIPSYSRMLHGKKTRRDK